MSDVTRILSQLEHGDPASSDQLLPLVYDELRRLAAIKLTQEKSGQTLQATALVHEAYVRLVGPGDQHSWKSKGHFFGAAAEAMRRILIDRARRKNSQKAGGNLNRVEFSEGNIGTSSEQFDLLALDEALNRLAGKDPRKAELVKLRFFAGLTNKQAAEAMGIATSTADADWAYAKCWLRAEMSS